MGATGLSMGFERIGESPKPLEELQRAYWSSLLKFLESYTESCESVWDSYLTERDPKQFAVEGASITFWFPDFGGLLSVSAGVVEHWIEAAVSVTWDRLVEIGQRFGWLLSSQRPTLAPIVRDSSKGYGYISLRDELWEFSFEPDWSGGDLHGDGKSIPLRDLSDDERKRLEEAVAARLCQCDMCVMLRPDPIFEETMRETLTEYGGPAESAVWYLCNAAGVSVKTALACAAIDVDDQEWLQECCRRLGEKLSVADWNTVVEGYLEASPARRSPLLAMMASMTLGKDAAGRRLEIFEKALAGDDASAEAAAQFATLVVDDSATDRFARMLVAKLGERTSFDRKAALALFNFYHHRAAPTFVAEAFRSLADHPDQELRELVTFAINQLGL